MLHLHIVSNNSVYQMIIMQNQPLSKCMNRTKGLLIGSQNRLKNYYTNKGLVLLFNNLFLFDCFK